MLLVFAVGSGLSSCAAMPQGRDRIVRAAPSCPDQTVAIYFEPFSADVSKEGRAVLKAAAVQARPCKVVGVDVLGLADNSGGDADRNLDLSKRRAQAVTNALTAIGLPAADFKLTAAGQTGAMTTRGESKPLRRRADVVLHLAAS